MSKRAEQFVTRVQFSRDELARLLARRRRARLGCGALARQLGVTVTAMDNYERGIRRIPAVLLPRWSRALGGWGV
jgi:transcriptional regulator with XRE-family HTH domain